MKVVTDARIGVVKAALQLTPEQEKLWPPVEEAIRARAEARYNRMVAVAGKLDQQREVILQCQRRIYLTGNLLTCTLGSLT